MKWICRYKDNPRNDFISNHYLQEISDIKTNKSCIYLPTFIPLLFIPAKVYFWRTGS